jgi:hypothetical protein
MERPTRDYICAALGVVIGVSCFVINNNVTKEWMEPLVAACTEGDYASHQERMLQEDIVAYEPLLGGGFVCIITQFLEALSQNYPGGMFTWGGVILVSFPFSIVGGVEAGRAGSRGPIRYSIAMGILAQLLGVCVVIPALWIPSYIFGGSNGAYSPQRPWHAVYTFLIPTMLTVFIFTLDSTSVAWRQCAALLGGPLLAFLPLVYYLSPTPRNVKEMQQNQNKAQEYYVNAFKLVGVLSFAGYIFLVYIAVSAYGFNMVTILNGLWQNAHPAVKFMTVDTTGFFLATLIYAYLQSPLQMLKMAMLVPLLGPGAAFSYFMVQTVPNYVVPKDDSKKQ